MLPLLLSVFLFFVGLVVFAFRSNNTVAHVTVAIVGFCALSYITFTLMPLIFCDCPYHTPLTSIIRFFAQIISLSFLLVLYHGEKQYKRWGTVSWSTVIYFRDRLTYRVSSLSENIVSKLENSAGSLSMDMYKNMLVRTVRWLNDDNELEEFVAGVPGLYQSEAFTHNDNSDTQRNIGAILAVLPGLTGFHESLPWNIVGLAKRASTNKLPKSDPQRTTQACLMALFYIPGAIRDVLAPYAGTSGK
ncbi:hypothetical protein H4582DRAFT_2215157 [Lactarius indigo]|nr:hypothetical protein H4582DRAFT_2215157 [Lactarius indigo]